MAYDITGGVRHYSLTLQMIFHAKQLRNLMQIQNYAKRRKARGVNTQIHRDG